MNQLEKLARAARDVDVAFAVKLRPGIAPEKLAEYVEEVSASGFFEALARAVLASIEVDDAMVEVAAEAAFAEHDFEFTWANASQSRKFALRSGARAALTASLRSILDNGAGT